eukprot:s3071_g3.t2
MLTALRETPDANAILPFVRLFYGSPSEFVWTDAANNPHSILQAEGGEQGDPLMPALFALRVAPALRAMQTDLLPSESVRAFLDDTYLTSIPPAGLPPSPDPESEHVHIWVGDTNLPAYQQSLKVLGTPLGTDEFVAAHLHTLSAQHRTFLQLLPTLPDLQVAWLLLLYCASPRAQYILRAVPPALTAVFAAEHARSMLHCLALLLQAPVNSRLPARPA